MKSFAFFEEPIFSGPSEKEYVMHYVSRYERAVARSYLYLASAGWLFPLIATMLNFLGPREGLLLISFYVAKATICVGLLRSKVSLKFLRYSVFVLLVVAQIVWMAAALIHYPEPAKQHVLPGMWIVYILIGNLLLPFRSYTHNFLFLLTLVTTYIGLRNIPERDLPSLVATVCLVLAQNYRIYIQRLIKAGSIKNFREQSRYIPRQVLMKAAKEDKSILELFAPSNRFCVCLCSDWRKFQSLSQGISMTTLGQGLADYYQSLVDMLYERFPDGQFFVDWIADELFLVIFASDHQMDKKLVEEAFQLSKDILNFKKDFYRKNGFPAGVDIGISCGVASVGIFGQGGIAKATAFGTTPGKARVLQDVAKRLRITNGSIDRVVMTAEVVQALEGFAEGTDCLKVNHLTPKLKSQLVEVFVWPAGDEDNKAGSFAAL